MGVKSLTQFLKKYSPNAINEVHLSNYAYKKVAIDISIFIFKYKTVSAIHEKWDEMNSNKWLAGIVNLVSCLRKNDIHCCFIFDTKAPIEKEKERQSRNDQREKYEVELFNLVDAYEKYNLDGTTNEFLAPFKQSGSLLVKSTGIDTHEVEKRIATLKSRTVKINSNDYVLSKRIFDIMDVPYAQAESEGETTCSHLCVLGKVDAVISEDNDVLAYGAPFLLTKINTDTETVMEISLERVLEDLEISKETFTDLCIMCGVDYNTNIPNYGPAKSYKMLKILGSIDKITDIDVSILKHERCRELFSVPKTIDYDIKYCGEPNYGELEKFISKNGINGDRRGLFKIDMNNIRKVNKCEIVFTE